MQSEREQTLVIGLISLCTWCLLPSPKSIDFSSFDPFGFGKDIKTMALNSKQDFQEQRQAVFRLHLITGDIR